MDGDDSSALRADRDYLFSSCLHLGRVLEEHDAEADTVVKRFRRDAQHKDALTVVRRLLKKYHTDEELPIRRYLAEWRVLRDKLLPMISRFHADACVWLLLARCRAALALPSAPISLTAPSRRAATFCTLWARCSCL